jgi:hypothetical protein
MGSLRFQAYTAQIHRINMAELIDQHVLSQRRPQLSLVAPRTASHDSLGAAPAPYQNGTLAHA